MKILHDKSGATALEYGLLGALIAVAVMGSVKAVGMWLGPVFGGQLMWMLASA